MATGDIKINVSEETVEIFKATRVIRCTAMECKNNATNFDNREVNCMLKRVFIVDGGKCEQYQPKEKP